MNSGYRNGVWKMVRLFLKHYGDAIDLLECVYVHVYIWSMIEASHLGSEWLVSYSLKNCSTFYYMTGVSSFGWNFKIYHTMNNDIWNMDLIVIIAFNFSYSSTYGNHGEWNGEWIENNG